MPPSGLTATSPTGEEWKERYVGEDGAGFSGGEAMGEAGAGCCAGGYADCVMYWILIGCVMRLGLVSMGYVPYVRRRMRRAGLRVTVRWGRLYTIEDVEIRQPDSEAQLRARGVLARASAMAKRELENPERRLYWDCHAAEMGYKTGRGACVAHYIKRLKALDALREEDVERMRRRAAERRARQEERRRREMMAMMEGEEYTEDEAVAEAFRPSSRWAEVSVRGARMYEEGGGRDDALPDTSGDW